MANKAPNNLGFSEREMETMAYAWQCIEGGDPKINNKKLALLAGYTEGSAAVTWGKIRRKLKAVADAGAEKRGVADGGAEDMETTPVKPATTPRKRKPKADGGHDESPTKKPRTPKGANAGAKNRMEVKPEPEEASEDVGEGDWEGSKIKNEYS